MVSKNQTKYVRQLEMKKFRKREGLFVAEGPKVVGDLMGRWQPRMLFATPAYLSGLTASGVSIPSETTVETVSDSDLERLSFLQHPQQVLALFPIPGNEAISEEAAANFYERHTDFFTDRLSLALDGVQDPGNLGTIIRVADWFGITHLFCSPDTADAWNPKVVQATMGSLARVNIIYINLQQLFRQLPPSYPVYGTLLDGKDIYQQELSKEGIIVMGNEGNGISPEVRQLVNRRLLIPSFHEGDRAESLNVAIATAITCSEFRRR